MFLNVKDVIGFIDQFMNLAAFHWESRKELQGATKNERCLKVGQVSKKLKKGLFLEWSPHLGGQWDLLGRLPPWCRPENSRLTT